jgi:diguanylate cyclase (GGDEF)-like protein/PAS domain S-box-containing protein
MRGRGATTNTLSGEQNQSCGALDVLLDKASDLVVVKAPDGTIRYISPSVRRILGYEPSELIGTSGFDLPVHEDRVAAARTLAEAVAHPDSVVAPIVVRVRHRDGSERRLELVISNHVDDPEIGGFVVNAADVTRRGRDAAYRANRGLHDPLTALPNRHLLIDRLERAVARGRDSGRLVGVLFIDLDDFRVVNEACGYAFGDTVLIAVANRLSLFMPPSDTVARHADDAFVVVSEGLTDLDEVVALADKLVRMVAEPFELPGDVNISVTASIGVAVSDPTRHQVAKDLLRAAQQALPAVRLQP